MDVDKPLADTCARMEFLKPHSWIEGDKPYQLLYMPNDGADLVNYDTHTVSDIPIHDMRPVMHTLSLDEQGFIVAKLNSQMSYDDFWDEEKLKTVYAADLRYLLTSITGARAMFIHECVIRRRSLSSKSHIDGYGQPISFAHTDYSPKYIRRLVGELTGPDQHIIDTRRIQMLNCWKPLRGPLRDWPLAVCDLRSVEPNDIVPLDEVHATATIESQQVLYNPAQKWYYLKEQEADEVLIFKGADTEHPGEVPHGAFQDPKCPADAPMRESIEVRVLVVY